RGLACRRNPRREAPRNSRGVAKVSCRAGRPRPGAAGPLGFRSRGSHEKLAEREAAVTLGILGGGQLGYMLTLAGYPLGLHFRFLAPSPEAPVGRIAHRVTADSGDHAALAKFENGLALVTDELENVPVESAHFL